MISREQVLKLPPTFLLVTYECLEWWLGANLEQNNQQDNIDKRRKSTTVGLVRLILGVDAEIGFIVKYV